MTLYWGRRKYITSCGDIYMMSILRLTWRLVNKYCMSCYNNSCLSCYFFDRKYENKYKINVNTKWYIYLMVCCYFTIVSETEPWASNVESDYTDLVSTNCCRGNQFTLPLERFFYSIYIVPKKLFVICSGKWSFLPLNTFVNNHSSFGMFLYWYIQPVFTKWDS